MDLFLHRNDGFKLLNEIIEKSRNLTLNLDRNGLLALKRQIKLASNWLVDHYLHSDFFQNK